MRNSHGGDLCIAGLLLLSPLVAMDQSFPTITMTELSTCIELNRTGRHGKTVLSGLLNETMNLIYSLPTDYTTGKRILPAGVKIEDVNEALKDPKAPDNVKNIFRKMKEKYESGDLTPEPSAPRLSATLTPVLQFIIMEVHE